MRARERVDDDLVGGRRVFGDSQTEPEDAVAIPVEEGVECLGDAVARRVHQIAVGASIAAGLRVSRELHAFTSSGRWRRVTRSFRSPPSSPRSTMAPFIGA